MKADRTEYSNVWFHPYKIQKLIYAVRSQDSGNPCEGDDGQVSGVLAMFSYLIWVLVTQVCSVCEIHPAMQSSCVHFFFSPSQVLCFSKMLKIILTFNQVSGSEVFRKITLHPHDNLNTFSI